MENIEIKELIIVEKELGYGDKIANAQKLFKKLKKTYLEINRVFAPIDDFADILNVISCHIRAEAYGVIAMPSIIRNMLEVDTGVSFSPERLQELYDKAEKLLLVQKVVRIAKSGKPYNKYYFPFLTIMVQKIIKKDDSWYKNTYTEFKEQQSSIQK